jgi:hypothetical protein
MSVKNFIPTIWSDKIFQSYDKNFVFAGLSNREYEGEISQFGDRVKVSEIGDMTATAYTGASLTYSEADDASKYLTIDQKYYIAKTLDDVDNAQTKPKLINEITRKMGIGFADNTDSYIAGLYTEAGITSGTTASPTSITSATITAALRDIGTSLSENNVPNPDRVAVVPPWFSAKIDLAKLDKDTNNSEIANNAYVGRYMGFDIYESNNISHSGTTWYAPMFFEKSETIAFAEQLMNMEALRDKDTFADYMRGLIVYGAKVMRPDSLAVLYCAEGEES